MKSKSRLKKLELRLDTSGYENIPLKQLVQMIQKFLTDNKPQGNTDAKYNRQDKRN